MIHGLDCLMEMTSPRHGAMTIFRLNILEVQNHAAMTVAQTAIKIAVPIVVVAAVTRTVANGANKVDAPKVAVIARKAGDAIATAHKNNLVTAMLNSFASGLHAA